MCPAGRSLRNLIIFLTILEKLPVSTLARYPSVIQHDNLLRMQNCTDSLRHDQNRTLLRLLFRGKDIRRTGN